MAIDLTQVTIDYTSKDFLAFRDDMFSLAEIFTPEWNNRADSDLGVMLVNEFAMGLDIISFYQDRVANEGFLSTAQLRKSVIELLKLVDYSLDTSAPSSVGVMFDIDVSATDTFIPIGFKVSTTATDTTEAVEFETTQSGTIPAGHTGTTSIDTIIPVGGTSADFGDTTGMVSTGSLMLWNGSEGEIVTIDTVASPTVTWLEPTDYAYSTTADNKASPYILNVTQGSQVNSESVATSNGLASQSYRLVNTPVVGPTIEVVVTESGVDVTYVAVDNFISSTSTDRHFTYTIDEEDRATIVFGNGTLGKIPPLGSPIVASYKIGGGASGNVGAGQINSIVSSSPNNVTGVTNSVPASGGSDRESIDEAKVNGPLSVKTNDRAVTKEDYEALTNSFNSANGAVSKSVAIATAYDNVDIYPAVQGPTGSGAIASAALKADLKTYLDSKSMIHVTTTIQDPTYSDFDITANVKVLDNYDSADVLAEVNTELTDYLSFLNQEFGGTLHVSEAYNLITNVVGVDYTNITGFNRNGDPVATVDVTALPTEIFQVGTITLNLI